MKATEHHFSVLLFVMLLKVALTFESVDEILHCVHSFESYSVVLSHGGVYYAIHSGCIVWVCGRNPKKCDHSNKGYRVHAHAAVMLVLGTMENICIKVEFNSQRIEISLFWTSICPPCTHPTEQYFPVVLFIVLYKVVLTFESVDVILKCDHSNQSYWAVLSCGAVYYVVQDGSNFWICEWNPKCDHWNGSYRAVLSRGVVYFVISCKLYFFLYFSKFDTHQVWVQVESSAAPARLTLFYRTPLHWLLTPCYYILQTVGA